MTVLLEYLDKVLQLSEQIHLSEHFCLTLGTKVFGNQGRAVIVSAVVKEACR